MQVIIKQNKIQKENKKCNLTLKNIDSDMIGTIAFLLTWENPACSDEYWKLRKIMEDACWKKGISTG